MLPPPPPPVPLEPGPFEATFGDCVVTQNGHCFQTPGFPAGYFGRPPLVPSLAGGYDCEVTVSYAVSLSATTWNTAPMEYFMLELRNSAVFFVKHTPPNGDVVGGAGEALDLLVGRHGDGVAIEVCAATL